MIIQVSDFILYFSFYSGDALGEVLKEGGGDSQ